MQSIGIGLREVLAFHVHAFEAAIERRLEHVRNAQAGVGEQRHAPRRLEKLACLGIRNVPVAAELVREGPHVAGTLHVVLTAQRIHADALAAEIAGRHGEVRDTHDHGRALAVLGDAEAVIDRTVGGFTIQARRGSHGCCRNPGDAFHRLG